MVTANCQYRWNTSQKHLSLTLCFLSVCLSFCVVCVSPPNTQTQTQTNKQTHTTTHTHCAWLCLCPSTPCFLHLHLCLSPHLSLPRLAEYNAVERDMRNDIRDRCRHYGAGCESPICVCVVCCVAAGPLKRPSRMQLCHRKLPADLTAHPFASLVALGWNLVAHTHTHAGKCTSSHSAMFSIGQCGGEK